MPSFIGIPCNGQLGGAYLYQSSGSEAHCSSSHGSAAGASLALAWTS